MLYGNSMPNPVLEWHPIIHRGLKNGNVLLGEKGAYPYAAYPCPKVTDFGLAAYNWRDGDHTFDSDGEIGTLDCTAPEQHRNGIGANTSKSDVWHLGCCLISLMLKQDGLQTGIGAYMVTDPYEPGDHVGT